MLVASGKPSRSAAFASLMLDSGCSAAIAPRRRETRGLHHRFHLDQAEAERAARHEQRRVAGGAIDGNLGRGAVPGEGAAVGVEDGQREAAAFAAGERIAAGGGARGQRHLIEEQAAGVLGDGLQAGGDGGLRGDVAGHLAQRGGAAVEGVAHLAGGARDHLLAIAEAPRDQQVANQGDEDRGEKPCRDDPEHGSPQPPPDLGHRSDVLISTICHSASSAAYRNAR
jgi:hypothetical protein